MKFKGITARHRAIRTASLVGLVLILLGAAGCTAFTTPALTTSTSQQGQLGSAVRGFFAEVEYQDAAEDVVSTGDWVPVSKGDVPGAADLLAARLTADGETLTIRLRTNGSIPPGPLKTSLSVPAQDQLSYLAYSISLVGANGSVYEINAALQDRWVVEIGQGGEITVLDTTPGDQRSHVHPQRPPVCAARAAAFIRVVCLRQRARGGRHRGRRHVVLG